MFKGTCGTERAYFEQCWVVVFPKFIDVCFGKNSGLSAAGSCAGGDVAGQMQRLGVRRLDTLVSTLWKRHSHCHLTKSWVTVADVDETCDAGALLAQRVAEWSPGGQAALARAGCPLGRGHSPTC